MAIKLPDGRIMRTLPEQVDKNMQDIASINNEVNVIKESLTTAYKIQGSATVADLNANTPDAAMNGYVYNMTDAGFLINSDESTTSVQIGDNVVLVWNDGSYFWDRLSGVVDTSNLVTLDTEQEITGKKILNGFYLPSVGGYLDIGNSHEIHFTTAQIKFDNNVVPWANNSYDLGSSSSKWKNLYLSGTVYSGDIAMTNSSKIYNNMFAVNNGSNDAFLIDGVNGQTKTRYNIMPFSNLGASLGTTTLKFQNVCCMTLNNGSTSINIADISKTKLYKHQMTVSNVTGPVNVILTHNTPITGSFGANMSSQIVIAAYLTAQSNASQMKTPNGGLAQINSDGTISITVSAGETITNDTVTEL